MRVKRKSQQAPVTKRNKPQKYIRIDKSIEKQSIPMIRSVQIDQQQIDHEAQIFRIFVREKFMQLERIWDMSQDQMCEYFSKYKPFRSTVIKNRKSTSLYTTESSKQGFTGFILNGKQLLKAPNLKLVRNEDKLYFGQIVNKKRQGMGISITKNQKFYQGYFQKNQRCGNGIQIYPNGNLYIGQFANNKKHGKGRFFWFDISSDEQSVVEYYQGVWWGGMPHGQGIHRRANGDLYKGTFQNGLKHGKGQQRFANGDFYAGSFVNGTPDGFGQYFWCDGSFYKGSLKQGLRSGFGHWGVGTLPFDGIFVLKQQKNSQFERTPNRIVQNYQGHYQSDKKSGYGVYQWENGWTYKGSFENDFRNGYGELYDNKDELVYKGNWINGEKEQDYIEYQQIYSKGKKIKIDGIGKKGNKSQLQNYQDKVNLKSERYYQGRRDLNGVKNNAFSKTERGNSQAIDSSHHVKTTKRPFTSNNKNRFNINNNTVQIFKNDNNFSMDLLKSKQHQRVISSKSKKNAIKGVDLNMINQIISTKNSARNGNNYKDIGKFYMPMKSTHL